MRINKYQWILILSILIILLLVYHIINIAFNIKTNSVIYGEDINKTIENINNKWNSEIDSLTEIDYALNDTIIFHNGYYLYIMKDGISGWKIDSLVNLRAIKCNLMQGSTYTTFKVSIDGVYVAIQNVDLEDDIIYPLYLYDTQNRVINKFDDGLLSDNYNIEYYDPKTKNIAPNKEKSFKSDEEGNDIKEVQRLSISDKINDLEFSLEVKKDYLNNFYFINNTEIVHLYSYNVLKRRLRDYHLVFYDLETNTGKEVKISN